MHKVDVLKLFRLWRSPLRNDELADALGVPRGGLHYLRLRYKLPLRDVNAFHRRVVGSRKRTVAKHLPSPEEIMQRAAEIRATWSDAEREKRAVGPGTTQWRMPAFAFARRDVSFMPVSLD